MDHGAVRIKWSHRESHSDLQRAELASSCWTMTPKAEAVGFEPTSDMMPSPAFQAGSSPVRMTSIAKGGSRETRTHKRLSAATCFQDRALIRPDGFHLLCMKSCGGWDRTNIKTFRASHPTVRRLRNLFSFESRLGRKGSGRRGRTFVAWFKARRPTASRSPIKYKSALWESNPPRQLGRLEPLPLGQRRTSRRKVRELNPQGREARPASNGVPSPVGLTFQTNKLRQKGSNLHPLLNKQVDYRYLMPDQKSQDGRI